RRGPGVARQNQMTDVKGVEEGTALLRPPLAETLEVAPPVLVVRADAVRDERSAGGEAVGEEPDIDGCEHEVTLPAGGPQGLDHGHGLALGEPEGAGGEHEA